jgi:hypothetical protein
LTGALWRYRHISKRVAIGAAVLSVIFPPWIFPGAGVLVVTIARCIAMGKSAHPPSLAFDDLRTYAGPETSNAPG